MHYRRYLLTLVVAISLVTLAQLAHGEPVPPRDGLPKTVANARSVGAAADQSLSIVRGTVTALSGWKQSFFLQDATGAISVDRLDNTPIHPGDEVEVTGLIKTGLFANILISRRISLLRSGGGLPHARPSTYRDLQTGRYDSHLVEVNGTIQAANIKQMWGRRILFLDLETGDGTVTVYVLNFAGADLGSLIARQVRITGVSGTVFNDRRQLIGLRLFVGDLSQITVVAKGVDPDALPISHLDSLLTFDGPQVNQCVRVQGLVTHQSKNGGDVFLQEGSSAIRVHSPSVSTPPGTKVDAWGFLSYRGSIPELRHGVVRLVGSGNVPLPVRVEASNVIKPDSGFIQAPLNGMLVQIEGTIVGRMPSDDSILLNLTSSGVGFQTQIPDAPGDWSFGLESGTRVRITGICVAETAEINDGSNAQRSFQILARSKQDVAIVQAAYWNQSLVVLLGADILILLAGILIHFVQKRQDYPFAVRENDLSKAERVATARRWQAYLIPFAVTLTAVLFAVARIGVQGEVLAAGNPFLHSGPILLTGLAMWLTQSDRSPTAQQVGIWGSWFAALGGCMILAADLARVELPYLLNGGTGINLATALSMALIAFAILCTQSNWSTGTAQVLAVIVAFNSLLKLIGSVFGASGSGGLATEMFFPAPNAAGFLALAVAILLSNPEQGLMKAAYMPRLGALMLRRALPAAIATPMVLGWLRLQLQTHGLIDTRFGLALYCTSLIACFCLILWISAITLNRLDCIKSQTEEALLERERKLELIFETGFMGDFNWDPKVDRVIAHTSVWRMYGESGKHETEPSDWFGQRQHPEDLPRIEGEMKAMQEQRRPFDLEFKVIWPDTTIHWISCRAVGAFDGNGTMIQMNGINLDITERKRSEANLKESDVRFSELQDAMPQIVWTAGETGFVQHYNRRWFEYTGLGPCDTWSKVVHPDDFEAMSEKWTQSIAARNPYEYEIPLRRASDSQYRWHLVRAVPVFDEQGALKHWFGTCTDVHDFKRASQEIEALNRNLERRVEERSRQLAQTEQKFKLLVESVRDQAIYMLDADGRVASWNEGAERLKGYSAEEAMGRHFSFFYSTRDVAAGAPERHLAIAKEEGRLHHELELARKDGSLFWASVSISAIFSDDGRIQGFSEVTHDMTERRRAEHLLIEAERQAQEANIAKSSFLAAMSHEIRTPMNAILGMADLLWETDLDGKQREYVGRFRRAGANLLTLVNDILDLSKIEAGRFELESVDFDLLEIVDRVMEIAAPAAVLKNLVIETHVVPGTNALLIGDPVRLQQVLNNLLSNAVKFTPQGNIQLYIEPHASGVAGHIQFAVSDSGIGIPADKLESIFEDFTQAESSTTRRFGGTGLGLGICRRLAEKMQGTVAADSQPGKGSTFRFDAVFKLSARVPEILTKDLSNLVGKPVLVIDDNATNRIIMCEMCASWGMVTRTAATGAEALAAITGARRSLEPFSLIMLDRVLPNADCFSILRDIQKIDPVVPVIISSSDNQSRDLTIARAHGAAAYLLKPTRRSELLSAVVAALSTATDRTNQALSESKEPILPMRILVADDSEDNRFLLEAYLASQPYELMFACNGRDAVDLFRREAFDLILMDIQMPVMDGLTAAMAIRALERQRSISPITILALSANALAEDYQSSLDAGCNAHLAKPISKDQLLGAIENYRSRITRSELREEVGEQPSSLSFEIEIPPGFEEMSRGYIKKQLEALSQVRKALANGQLDQVRHVGHNMKGTGTPYGFPDLAKLGAAIENAAKTSNLQVLGTCVDELETYVRHAVEHLG